MKGRILDKLTNRLLVIVASEGGPPVVHSILSQLDPEFPVPIVVYQGYQTGTVKALCNAWNKTSQLAVAYAGDVTPLLPRTVTVLPYECSAEVDITSAVPCLVKSQRRHYEESDDPVAKFLKSAGNAFGDGLRLALAGGQIPGIEAYTEGVEIVVGSGGTVCSVMETGAIATCRQERKGESVSLINSDEFVSSIYAWIGRTRRTPQAR